MEYIYLRRCEERKNKNRCFIYVCVYMYHIWRKVGNQVTGLPGSDAEGSKTTQKGKKEVKLQKSHPNSKKKIR